MRQGRSEGELQLRQAGVEQSDRADESTEAAQTLDSELKKYEIVAMDGTYEYMGLLYSTPENAIAAAKRNRGEI